MIEDQNRKESSKTKVAPSKETNNNKKKMWKSLKLSVGISHERNN